MTSWSKLRDGALFLLGALGVAHETLLANAERPTLLILFAADARCKFKYTFLILDAETRRARANRAGGRY